MPNLNTIALQFQDYELTAVSMLIPWYTKNSQKLFVLAFYCVCLFKGSSDPCGE